MMTIDTKAMKKTEDDDEDDDDAKLHGFSPACRVRRGSWVGHSLLWLALGRSL